MSDKSVVKACLIVAGVIVLGGAALSFGGAAAITAGGSVLTSTALSSLGITLAPVYQTAITCGLFGAAASYIFGSIFEKMWDVKPSTTLKCGLLCAAAPIALSFGASAAVSVVSGGLSIPAKICSAIAGALSRESVSNSIA